MKSDSRRASVAGGENDAHMGVCLLPQDGTHAVVADLKSCSSTAKRTLALTSFHIYNYSCPGILGCVCFAASTFDVL